MDQSYVYTDEERKIVKDGVGEISKVLFGEDDNAKRRLLFYLDWYLDPYYQNDLNELYEPIKEMLQDVIMKDNEDDIKEEALHLLDVYMEPPFVIFKENINAVPKQFLLEVKDLIKQEDTSMNQYERMVKGLLYDPNAAEIMDKQVPFQDKLWEFNKLKPSDYEKKQQYMREVFAECGDNCYIELPFRANWGGHHLHFGSGIYANANLTLVDDGHIYVGDKVMFGPNVIISTASHPVNPELRARGLQYNKDVKIEENVWIGAGAIILAGICIGKNSVIGAGSVVTHDIPDNVIAVGNPCRILREISERDREYFYKEERIDWENLEEE